MFSAVQVVSPPALEPVSVDFARRHMRVDTLDDSDLIANYITAARTWVEMYLGRVLIAQQLRYIMSREQPPSGYPYLSLPLSLLILPLWYPWPLNTNHAIPLPRQPIISVDGVAYGQYGNPDTTLVSGTDYNFDLLTGNVRIKPNSIVLPNDHLAILFTAGYGVDGTTIPTPVITAILLLTAYLYENRGDAGGEMPYAAEMLLAPYRIVRFG